MTKHPPAAMSAEAQLFLARGSPTAHISPTELPIEEIRSRTREVYRPASEQAVKTNGVTCAHIEVAGIDCLEISPPQMRDTRQLIHLFGGGFVQGSPFEDLPISATLAAKTGARVISPTYRLAPEHPFPAALEDVTAVTAAVLTDNPGTLLVGESAGGNLALALVHRLRQQGQSVPKAVATLSPATDLDFMGDSHNADRDPFLPAAGTDFVCAAYLGDTDPQQPEVSPIYGKFDANFPPTLVTTGTRDLLLSGCVRLARVMREAGAPVDLRIWEGMWHVFEFFPGTPEAEASLSEIAAFLEGYF
ncbi:MAG: alpha/beta hydrolase [Pseudomonadota bacterium]